jgi:hypothetical protein
MYLDAAQAQFRASVHRIAGDRMKQSCIRSEDEDDPRPIDTVSTPQRDRLSNLPYAGVIQDLAEPGGAVVKNRRRVGRGLVAGGELVSNGVVLAFQTCRKQAEEEVKQGREIMPGAVCEGKRVPWVPAESSLGPSRAL